MKYLVIIFLLFALPTYADNPAIVNMQAQVDKTDEVMTAHLLAVESRLVRLETKADQLITNQNLIPDKLTQ